MNIVITGASTGIGFQAALHLTENGHNVFALARRKPNLFELQAESEKRKSAGKLFFRDGDITGESALEEIFMSVSAALGTVDILINNAGMLVNKAFHEITADEWTAVYSTNVFAPAALIRKLLPLFSSASRSHIVNIGSMGGFQGSVKFKGLSAYSSSKAALAGLTECLAEEFKEINIAVNCLCLGSVQTEMFHAAFPDSKAAGTPEETGKFIADFALNGSRFFNGKVIPVSSSTP